MENQQVEEDKFHVGKLQPGHVVSDYAVKLLWEVYNGYVELDNRVVFIGDSNLRDTYETCWSYDILKTYHKKFVICSEGGRRLLHLAELFPSVAHFKYICILLGGNDLREKSVDEMLQYILQFKQHLPAEWPKQILCVVELFERSDQTEEPLLSKLKNFNARLKTEFRAEYFPNTVVKASAFPHPCDSAQNKFFYDQNNRLIPNYHLKVQCRSQYAKHLSKICDFMFNRACVPNFS